MKVIKINKNALISSPLNISTQPFNMVDVLIQEENNIITYLYKLDLLINIESAANYDISRILIQVYKPGFKNKKAKINTLSFFINIKELINSRMLKSKKFNHNKIKGVKRNFEKGHARFTIEKQIDFLYSPGLDIKSTSPDTTGISLPKKGNEIFSDSKPDPLGSYSNFTEESIWLSYDNYIRMPNVLKASIDLQNFPKGIDFLNKKKIATDVVKDQVSIIRRKNTGTKNVSPVSLQRKRRITNDIVFFNGKKSTFYCHKAKTFSFFEDISRLIEIPRNFAKETDVLNLDIFLITEKGKQLAKSTRVINHKKQLNTIRSTLTNDPIMLCDRSRNGTFIKVKKNSAHDSSEIKLVRYSVSPKDFELSNRTEIPVQSFSKNYYKFKDPQSINYPMFFVYKAVCIEKNKSCTAGVSEIVPGIMPKSLKVSKDFGGYAKILCYNISAGIKICIYGIHPMVDKFRLIRQNITNGVETMVDAQLSGNFTVEHTDNQLIAGDKYRYYFKYTIRTRSTSVSPDKKFKKSKTDYSIVRRKMKRRIPVPSINLTSEVLSNNAVPNTERVKIKFNFLQAENPTIDLSEFGLDTDLKPVILSDDFVVLFMLSKYLPTTDSKELLGYYSGKEDVIDTLENKNASLVTYLAEPCIVHKSFIEKKINIFKHPVYISTGIHPSHQSNRPNSLDSIFEKGRTGVNTTTTIRNLSHRSYPTVTNIAATRANFGYNIVSWNHKKSSVEEESVDYFIVIGEVSGKQYLLGIVENSGFNNGFYFIDKKLSNIVGKVEYSLKIVFGSGATQDILEKATAEMLYSVNNAMINFNNLKDATFKL